MPERLLIRFDDDSLGRNASSAVKKSALKNTKPSSPQVEKCRASRTENSQPKTNKAASGADNAGKPYLQVEAPSNGTPDAKRPKIHQRATASHGFSDEPRQSNLKGRANELLSIRRRLPIWSHGEAIRRALGLRDVLLLVGETGSGKSTQVPQFLLLESWCQPQNVEITLNGARQLTSVGGCIAVTEPRRVAAITLARRVAEEMGTPLGASSPASKVGYSVRFDNSTSPSTRIKFLTEGMLLQEMLRDPWLRQYSAVIVDEVHERGVNVDLVMGFLQKMVTTSADERTIARGGAPLKIVIMSATTDVKALEQLFQNAALGKALKDRISPTDDGAKRSGFSDAESTEHIRGHESRGSGDADPMLPINEVRYDNVSICKIEGRQYPVKVFYTPEPVNDWVEAALRTIFNINYKEPLPGDILVFMTGQETIESLERLVNEYASGISREVPQILVLPLFAALPQSAQQKVFERPPRGTRKVILATNIAETSITVPGVRYVVDCGKSKIKQFRARLGLDSLLVKPVSQSSATQRKGRAGRESPGQCYRLYTEKDYQTLETYHKPEILRCDLAQAILNMKARGADDVFSFPLIDRPSPDAIDKALIQLWQIGAVQADGRVSDTGRKIARLPLSVRLGRVLLAATEGSQRPDCLSEVIDIISCLSVENVFLNAGVEKNEEDNEQAQKAELARSSLFRREGDHLTLLRTVQGYVEESVDRKAWAQRHFVSHRAMRAVMDVRKQLWAQVSSTAAIGQGEQHSIPEPHSPSSYPRPLTSERAERIIKCFLRGFCTNTAVLQRDGSYRTLVGGNEIAVHPASVLFGRKTGAIMYNEYVYTSRSYARGVSAVRADWIAEVVDQLDRSTPDQLFVRPIQEMIERDTQEAKDA